jgi:hypothetical protein
MTRPATLPVRRLYETERLRRALDEHGAAYIPGALDARLSANARTAIDALAPVHWDEVHHDPRGLSGGRFLDRYLCVFNRDPYWLGFLDRPGVIELTEAVLGRDCHVIGQTAWRSHAGFRGEPLHVDYLPPGFSGKPVRDEAAAPAFILTVHYYLCDVGPALAPTRVVPGSHRAARAPLLGEQEWRGVRAQPVLAAAGDALVFRSDVWHAGSDNTTADGVRYLLQVHYGRREMAQHFSPYLEWRFDPAVLAAATRRQRRLLGDHEPGAYD